ncbi:MAG TPA: hypothetical protein PLN21_16620 [Gemmatales bacterium]|nr:hypothetical protein [Gemmatales bacterium]
MSARKGKRQQDAEYYSRQLDSFIPQYIAEAGDREWTTEKVAAWAIHKGLYERGKVDAIKYLARQLARVAREASFVNEEGYKVRKYHAFRLGQHQPMLWAEMEKISREQMHQSKTMRRNKLAGGAISLFNDLTHYNKHHNSGDPLLFDPDLTRDIQDSRHSDTYDDKPPEEENPST